MKKEAGIESIEAKRWLTDGNCILCIRFLECEKPCKAQQKRKKAILDRLAHAREERLKDEGI